MKRLVITGGVNQLTSMVKQNRIRANRRGLVMSLEDSNNPLETNGDDKEKIESLKSEIKTLRGKLLSSAGENSRLKKKLEKNK